MERPQGERLRRGFKAKALPKQAVQVVQCCLWRDKKGSAAVLVWTLTMTWVEEEELTAEMQSIAGAKWQL